MPGLMTLSATRRLTGSRCSAIQTVPMPPSPICFEQLVTPGDEDAGSLGRRWLVDRTRGRSAVQELRGLRLSGQHALNAGAQFGVVAARLAEDKRPARRPRVFSAAKKIASIAVISTMDATSANDSSADQCDERGLNPSVGKQFLTG